jgi:hypothetical protein
MKKQLLIAVALLVALVSYSQPAPMPPAPMPPGGLPGGVASRSVVAPAQDPVNYLIHVEWLNSKGESNALEVLTAEGNFELNTFQKAVKINNNDVPTTLRFNGTIKSLDDTKARLQLYLGRTVPYITGTSSGPSPASTYSQMSVGLDSALIVKFGKAAIIQNDENGQISILVKRIAD